MGCSMVYLDTYVLQQDMRIRMPKAILSNLNAVRGKTAFDVFFDSDNKSVVLKIHGETDEESTE